MGLVSPMSDTRIAMTLDGSYLKQNSTPLLDLLQETSIYTIEGVKKELPQCTTLLTSTGDWRYGRRWLDVLDLPCCKLWIQLSLSWPVFQKLFNFYGRWQRNRSQVWPFLKLSRLVWGNGRLRWDEAPRDSSQEHSLLITWDQQRIGVICYKR